MLVAATLSVPIERAIQIFFVIHMVAMGISHIVQPRVWVDFFVRLREWGEPGVFVSGFLSLMFGSIVVAFHDVWHGIPLLVTLLGWAHVVKGVLYFALPSVGMAMVGHERARRLALAGVLMLVFAGAVAFHLLAG